MVIQGVDDAEKDKDVPAQSLFEVSIPDDDVRAIRETLEASYPLGNTRFKEQIEAALGRKLGKLKRGGRIGTV